MDTQTRTEESNSFGYWLRRRRKSLDWTQAELARRVNCTAAMIRKIEADERKPSRELAGLLSDALRVSSEERETFLQAARDVQAVERLVRGARALPLVEQTPNNLPASLTSFSDRVHDNAAVVAMLTREDVRLLTLIGLPGIGKTRLCIRCAKNVLSHFPDGVWFVDLAAITEPVYVLPTIARMLNIAESGAQTPAQQLHAAFKDKRVLLALDNFEQIVDAARDVVELLKACKGMKVLATSRVPLHVYGEHEYALPPMSLPTRDLTPNKLDGFESVQLFLARVREHQPRFTITMANAAHVTEVCVRLDGVPLALELAAASLRRMTIEQLVAALSGELNWLSALYSPARDFPPRQQTLYNAIAWSYSLLDGGTQFVFRQLGVLIGKFDLQAATAICALDENQMQNALARLTDHSLLVRESTRWRMLEMIREFALEQMPSDERASAQQRHALHFAARLNMIAPEDAPRIELDHDNFRAALRWAIHARDGSLALTMGNPLADFWETRGYLCEGLALAREVLAIAENVEPSLRMSFLSRAAHLAWNKHEFDAALELNTQAIALARTSGLGGRLASAFNVQARIFIEQGDYARAEQTLRECLEIAQKNREEDARARALTQLGKVALACGKLDDAQSLSEQALAQLGDRIARFSAMAYTNLAEVALVCGDYARARTVTTRVAVHLRPHSA